MKDISDTPFWGKQKPLKHYFYNGVISFSVSKNQLFYTLTRITKEGKFPLLGDRVNNKEHLDKLLGVKDILEI